MRASARETSGSRAERAKSRSVLGIGDVAERGAGRGVRPPLHSRGSVVLAPTRGNTDAPVSSNCAVKLLTCGGDEDVFVESLSDVTGCSLA